MTRLLFALHCLPLLSLLLVGCQQRPVATPRPMAYPHMELYPATYTLSHGLALNDSARLDSLSPEWFNIVYPRYGVTINCSRTHVGSPAALTQVIDNRLERFERNLGTHAGQATTLTSQSGWGGLLFVAPTALNTPVQFLATDSVSVVLSGTAVFRAPGSSPDSISPIINALEADMLYLLKQL